MALNNTQSAAYASLLLHDCGLPITVANIATLQKAAKVNVYDANSRVYEDTLKVTPITNFIGAVGGSGATTTSAPAAASAPAKKEEAKKVVEETKEEEADMDMGDLFG